MGDKKGYIWMDQELGHSLKFRDQGYSLISNDISLSFFTFVYEFWGQKVVIPALIYHKGYNCNAVTQG